MPRMQASLPKLGPAFSVRQAQTLGVGAGTLRHTRFEVPYFGVRSLAGSEEQGRGTNRAERVLRSARLFMPRLRPGEAFTHETALFAYGCPIWAPEELHVVASPVHTRTRVAGVRGHESSAPFEVAMWGGLPLVAPITALTRAAGSLSVRELVVAIDHLTRRHGKNRSKPSLVEPEVLRLEVEKFRGRGAAVLRQAIGLATSLNESRMETLTWLLLVTFSLAEGFELQLDVGDEDGWIGRFDFVHLAKKLIVEFDGEQHRTDRAQYVRDLRRLDRARNAGYTVIRLLAEDVLHRPYEVAERIARELGVVLALRPQHLHLITP